MSTLRALAQSVMLGTGNGFEPPKVDGVSLPVKDLDAAVIGVADKNSFYVRSCLYCKVKRPVDLAGAAAGNLKMPYLKFLFWCCLGQMVKMLFFAFLGKQFFNLIP